MSKLYILLVLLLPTCHLTPRCDCPSAWTDIAQHRTIASDTVLIIDPRDYKKQCFVNDWYREDDASADSIAVIGFEEGTVRCLWKDGCQILLSARREIPCSTGD